MDSGVGGRGWMHRIRRTRAQGRARAPPWVLHIEHIVALATLNRCQLLLKGGLQDGGARGALELEGRLGGHGAFLEVTGEGGRSEGTADAYSEANCKHGSLSSRSLELVAL